MAEMDYEKMPDILDGRWFKKHLPYPDWVLKDANSQILSRRAREKHEMGDLPGASSCGASYSSSDEGF